MVHGGTGFLRNADSRICTANAAGLPELLDCLNAGATIVARQSATAPIAKSAALPPRLICETSGTSGAPKAICRKPDTWIRSFEISKRQFKISRNDTYATFGSLGHSLCLYAILEGLWIGADICNFDGVGPRRQAAALVAFDVTVIYATPTQLQVLLRGAQASQITNFATITQVFCGGGTLTPALRSALSTYFPNAEVREFFGASETSFMTMSDAATPAGSVGRAYPDVDIRIGTPQAPVTDQSGEIWVKSPYLFDSYATGHSDSTIWHDGFLSIGEMGYVDDDGFLFIQGRKDRMITVADHNVYPEAIEKVVSALDGVETCAVIAMADPIRGHVPVCVVQARASGPDAQALAQQCRDALGGHAVPKAFHFVTDLPVLASGKPDLEALRKTYGAC